MTIDLFEFLMVLNNLLGIIAIFWGLDWYMVNVYLME